MQLSEKNRILGRVTLGVFVVSMLVGAIWLFDSAKRGAGITVMLVSFAGMVFSFADKIVKWILKTEIPFSIMLFLNVFIILATIPGEIFGAYYKLWWWDMFLHTFSGIGIASGVFEVLKRTIGKGKTAPKVGWLVLMAVMMTLGGGLIWEVTEFTIDSMFEDNKQKFIPEEFLVKEEGWGTRMEATSEQIVEFYGKREGYRYALMDTMEDHICFLTGALVWVAGWTALRGWRKKKG